jgi:hypothetical protein
MTTDIGQRQRQPYRLSLSATTSPISAAEVPT